MITATAFLFFAFSGVLYSSKWNLYQIVDIYVCEEGIVLAELLAKARLNRHQLTVVSYCTCEGVDPSLKTEVKNATCEPPKDMVYSCTCIGKSHY
ncbi:MAG: hypothetical protein A2176_06660 [Spirochaetes bacterium RBG_13_51_14]|nr:MAG: hypothetical protein A2176_06660 [Spirochaetes bacterium RBG_13_51_14]